MTEFAKLKLGSFSLRGSNPTYLVLNFRNTSFETPDFPKIKSTVCSKISIYFLYFYLELLLSIRNFNFLNNESLLAIAVTM